MTEGRKLVKQAAFPNAIKIYQLVRLQTLCYASCSECIIVKSFNVFFYVCVLVGSLLIIRYSNGRLSLLLWSAYHMVWYTYVSCMYKYANINAPCRSLPITSLLTPYLYTTNQLHHSDDIPPMDPTRAPSFVHVVAIVWLHSPNSLHRTGRNQGCSHSLFYLPPKSKTYRLPTSISWFWSSSNFSRQMSFLTPVTSAR